MPYSSWLFRWRAWPGLILASVVLLFVVGTATVRETYRGWRVEREIRALEAQADELEGRNSRLRELARDLQSSDRVELEARQRLGLRQSGEHVVVLQGLATTGSWSGNLSLDVVSERPVRDEPSHILWWYYFFNPDRLDRSK